MSENDKTANMSDQLKSQESQLRSKYGIDKRKGNSLLMKKLASKKQYFDSGDYNIQKSLSMYSCRQTVSYSCLVVVYK